MSKDTDYVATLIDFTVSDDNERVDLEACLEIADRVNATKAECNEAIKCIARGMCKSNMKVVLNTLQLLETLCKNCNMRFLYELNNKKLVEAMVKNLQRRRDKIKYKMKDTKKPDPLRTEVEDKTLYLIQLMADTFMMHQQEFRNIHDAYRALRKDGVPFPDREINNKYMINFQGQISPIFLAMEGNYVAPSNNQGGPVNDRLKTEGSKPNKPKAPEYKHEVQNTLYDENDEDYNYGAYDGMKITPDELRVLEESMNVLKGIEKSATKAADMKGEVAKEILSDLVHVHKRLKHFIKSEKFLNTAHRNEAIKLNHNLTSCLSAYKTKYYKLKEEGRRVKTEVDEDYSHRRRKDEEEEESNRKGVRLQTEVDESYQNDRRPNNDFGNRRSPYKANAPVNKPDPWQASLEAEKQNVGHNPDLVDLLNTSVRQLPGKAGKVEERKEDTRNTNKLGSQKLVQDLLDMDFLTGPTGPSQKSKNLIENNDLDNKKMQISSPPQGTTNKHEALKTTPNLNSNDMFDFRGQTGPSFSSPKTGIAQPKFAFASPKFVGSPIAFNQPKFSNVPARNLVTMGNADNDDDDFFNDIANRKKK